MSAATIQGSGVAGGARECADQVFIKDGLEDGETRLPTRSLSRIQPGPPARKARCSQYRAPTPATTADRKAHRSSRFKAKTSLPEATRSTPLRRDCRSVRRRWRQAKNTDPQGKVHGKRSTGRVGLRDRPRWEFAAKGRTFSRSIIVVYKVGNGQGANYIEVSPERGS